MTTYNERRRSGDEGIENRLVIVEKALFDPEVGIFAQLSEFKGIVKGIYGVAKVIAWLFGIALVIFGLYLTALGLRGKLLTENPPPAHISQEIAPKVNAGIYTAP